MAYLALFVALSAGAYAAGLAPDSVRSKHIRDGQVKAADIGDGQVKAADIGDGEVGTADLAEGGVAGSDLANNSVSSPKVVDGSLGGADIDESSLGTVPAATQALIAGHGGFGRQSGGDEEGASCDPESATYEPCAVVNMSTTAAGRALVVGRIKAVPEPGAGDNNGGHCRLGSNAGPIPGTTVQVTVDSDGAAQNATEWLTVVGVSGTLSPGAFSFGIDCYEDAASETRFLGARVTTVMIGPA